MVRTVVRRICVLPSRCFAHHAGAAYIPVRMKSMAAKWMLVHRMRT